MIDWSKVLGVGLGILLFFSIIWFLINAETRKQLEKFHAPTEIVQQEPFNWGPIATGTTSITLFLLKYFLIERKKKKKGELSSGDLKDHTIFDTIEDMLENDLKYKNFGSDGRTEVMREIIYIQLDTYRTALKQFISDNPSFEDHTDFRKKVRACVYKMIDECEARWEQRQIPKPILNKYSDLYKQRIDLLLGDIVNASFSSLENNEAINVFLNDARIIFKTGLQEDVMFALRSLNGELKDLTFNGKAL